MKTDVIGYIGLGEIGAPMARPILAAGYSVVVWNRTHEKAKKIVDAGAEIATSPVDLAEKTDIIFTCLGSEQALETILFGADGITKGEVRATLLVDNATCSPAFARATAKKLKQACNMDMIDVPVSGGAIGAAAGTLAAMAGGAEEFVERARPIIASYASQISHMGELGAGQATKACNQIINFGNIATLAEALNLAQDQGIDIAGLPEAIDCGFAGSNVSREYDRSVQANDYSPVRILVEALMQQYKGKPVPELAGQLDILLKDMSIALNMARESGVPLPMLSRFDGIFRMIHHWTEDEKSK